MIPRGIALPFFASPREAQATTTFDASNTTASETIWTVTGSVFISRIWAEVSTIIGVNHTAGFLRQDDGAAQQGVTADGVALSGLAVGTVVYKEALAAVALTLLSNATGVVSEPAAAGDMVWNGFMLVKKATHATVLEYRYTTTDTPTSGALTWHAIWYPLSNDGALA